MKADEDGGLEVAVKAKALQLQHQFHNQKQDQHPDHRTI